VAGVFREEQNADNLVIELRNQGYNSEKFGKIGKLHAVSFGVYTSKSEAEKELRRIKQGVNPEAWIKVVQ
jgi:cell division septation protein DedD